MADSFQVACERCAATLKLKNRDSVGKKVACPKCGHKFIIEAIDDDDYNHDGDEFGAPGAQPAALGRRSRHVRRRPAPSRPVASRRARKSSAKPPWLWIGVGAAALVVVGLLLLIPWRGSGTALIDSTIVNQFNPFSADTPASVLAELEGYVDDALPPVQSILKGGSAESGATKLKHILTGVEDLYLRAVRIEPVPLEELTKFLKENPLAMLGLRDYKLLSGQTDKKSVFSHRRELDEKASGEGAGPINDASRALWDLDFATSKVLHVFGECLVKPADAKNADDGIEIAMIDVVRKALHDLSRVGSQSELEEQTAKFNEQADRLKTLASQLPPERRKLTASVDKQTGAYRAIRVKIHDQIDGVLTLLTKRHGKYLTEHRAKNKELASAVKNFRRSDALPADPSDPISEARFMAEANEERFEKLAKEHGKNNLLRITHMGEVRGINGSGAILHGMHMITGKESSTRLEVPKGWPDGIDDEDVPESTMTWVYMTDMDVNAVAAKIDFGTVLNVDVANREIKIKDGGKSAADGGIAGKFDPRAAVVSSTPDVIWVYVPSAIGEAEGKRILEGLTSILGVPTDRSGGDSKKMDVFKFASKADPKEIESKITFATVLHVSPEHRTIQIASPEQEARIRRRKEDQNDVIHQNIAKHGSDKLIIIGAPKTLDAAGQKKIADGMQAILGVAPLETGLTREVTAFIFLSTADPQATADKIRFAKVSKVVAEKRAILLEAPAS